MQDVQNMTIVYDYLDSFSDEIYALHVVLVDQILEFFGMSEPPKTFPIKLTVDEAILVEHTAIEQGVTPSHVLAQTINLIMTRAIVGHGTLEAKTEEQLKTFVNGMKAATETTAHMITYYVAEAPVETEEVKAEVTND